MDLRPRPAADQMSIDSAMVTVAEREGVALLRLYRWQESSVSFGANESALRHWNRAALEADQVPCVRRPTGGRAVWHDRADLTYAWTGPAVNHAEVRRIYRDLHERLAAAIATPGRAAALAAGRGVPGLVAGACFDVPVGGEVLVDGRKVIGSAQRVYGARVLQHGAIAVQDQQHRLGQYRRAQATTSDNAHGTRLDDAEATAAAIVGHWQRAGADEIGEELTSRILLASVEYRSHYLDPAWTWRR